MELITQAPAPAPAPPAQTQLHPVLDFEERWTTDMRPPAFDREGFQKRVDRITGLNRDGKSIVKLVWLPEEWTFLAGERVKRYWVRRHRDGEGWLYVSPPRWALERRIEREAYWDAHQASRFQQGPDGELIDLGPPPEDYYIFDPESSLVATHEGFRDAVSGDPRCCEERYRRDRRRCWGHYREPDERDLQRIARAVRERDEGKFFDPYAPVSREQLALIEMAANVQAERVERAAEERLREVSREFNRLHGWRLLNTDAGKKSQFFTARTPGFRQSEGGLFVPES